jgi:hypothetical protein
MRRSIVAFKYLCAAALHDHIVVQGATRVDSLYIIVRR